MHSANEAVPWSSLTRAMLLLMMLIGCSPSEKFYSAAPVGGRVIDETTREPISGAYVVAVYILEMGMEGGSTTPLHYEETRTNEEGRFHFSGFEKKRIPYERATRNALLSSGDPKIFIFAEGYQPFTIMREIDSRIDRRSHRVSPLDGQDLPLTRMGSLSNKNQWILLRRYLGSLSNDLNSSISPATGKSIKCAFNAIPSTRDYFMSQSDRLIQTGKVDYITLRIRIPQTSDCFSRND